MTEIVPVAAFDANAERWTAALLLVGEWLMEHSGNTRAAYADAIGWPYGQSGQWRGYTTRKGRTWLAWCHSRGVHLFDAVRFHALAWMEVVNASGLSKRSRGQMLSAASSFYIWATDEGRAERNPIATINRGKQGLRTSHDPSRTRSLSKAEAAAILQAADSDPVEGVRLRSAAIVSLLLVGPRVSEICRATLADLTVMDGRRALHVTLKGGADHYFALPPMVCQRLDHYVAARRDLDLLPARRDQPSAFSVPLVATATGRPVNRREVSVLVKRLAKSARIEDPDSIHPHVFRHTYITEARRQGHATAEIQHSVGHRQSSTTDRYGTHIIALERSPAYGVAEAFELAGSASIMDRSASVSASSVLPRDHPESTGQQWSALAVRSSALS